MGDIMLGNIDAVIFDMDGTIIDSMWVWKKVDADFLKKREISIPEDMQKQIEGLSFTQTAKYFKDRFGLQDEIDEIKNEWLDMVAHFYSNTIPLKEGVPEFLSILKRNGIKIGLATCNSRDLVNLVLKRTGIYNYFNSIVTSCEVEKDKSFPDIFLHAAKQLEVPPSRCLVFEDTLCAIMGAKKAGMKVIAVADDYSLPYKNEIISYADNYIIDFCEIA
jgi:HAD superfamily hydrolase (TIGR01509 family)